VKEAGGGTRTPQDDLQRRGRKIAFFHEGAIAPRSQKKGDKRREEGGGKEREGESIRVVREASSHRSQRRKAVFHKRKHIRENTSGCDLFCQKREKISALTKYEKHNCNTKSGEGLGERKKSPFASGMGEMTLDSQKGQGMKESGISFQRRGNNNKPCEIAGKLSNILNFERRKPFGEKREEEESRNRRFAEIYCKKIKNIYAPEEPP